MSKIIAIIQARTGSQRLPEKVLRKIEGRAVLEHIIDRISRSRKINTVIVATTILKEDLKIVRLCAGKGIRVYCGSEDDVLDRYYQAARLLKAEHVVRITGDCPLIDPKIIDEVVQSHIQSRADYTANTITPTFPDGEDVEIFTFQALEKAWQKATLLSEREHVTAYIWKNKKIFKCVNVAYKEDLSSKRWTLDNIEDYAFIKAVYKHLYLKGRVFGMEDILRLLNKYPVYEKINSRSQRNEGYIKSLREDKVITA